MEMFLPFAFTLDILRSIISRFSKLEKQSVTSTESVAGYSEGYLLDIYFKLVTGMIIGNIFNVTRSDIRNIEYTFDGKSTVRMMGCKRSDTLTNIWYTEASEFEYETRTDILDSVTTRSTNDCDASGNMRFLKFAEGIMI
ncbi:hypothetical protein JTB14_013976 [Gonioctena quinquepunctata]|nr:hypothetical protein JTB14_013976 [Gonioctena quinquepunctata]